MKIDFNRNHLPVTVGRSSSFSCSSKILFLSFDTYVCISPLMLILCKQKINLSSSSPLLLLIWNWSRLSEKALPLSEWHFPHLIFGLSFSLGVFLLRVSATVPLCLYVHVFIYVCPCMNTQVYMCICICVFLCLLVHTVHLLLYSNLLFLAQSILLGNVLNIQLSVTL